MTAPETTAAVERLRHALVLARDRMTMLLGVEYPESDHPVATQYIIDQANLALASQPPTDGGWVLVPREPNEAQLKAGNRVSLSTDVLMDDTRFACERATYRAMIAAAPLPVPPDQGEGK